MTAEKNAKNDKTNNKASEPPTTSAPPKEKSETMVLTKSAVSEEEAKTVSTASLSLSPPPKELRCTVPLTVTNNDSNSISEADQKAPQVTSSNSKPATTNGA